MPTPGTRIELVAMPDDPDPIPPGTRGTVTRTAVHRIGTDRWTEVTVTWDNGRTLALCVPPDRYRPLTEGDTP